ncbi:MAG: hypothetical protein IPG64_15005 [Haliea sp.]|nr:hypothetical protein [Haliea sp.]
MTIAHDPIIKIELFPVFLPFREYVRDMLQGGSGKVAMGLKVDDHWLGADILVCRMTTENGVVGIGDLYIWLVESAVSPQLVASVIKNHLARFVLGQSAFDMEAIQEKFCNNVAHNDMAKGLIDLTLYDVAARSIGRPVHDLCGGKQIDRIPMSMVLPLTDIETILEVVKLGQAEGVGSFRCKLGDGARRDVEIISAVRELIGPDAGLRVDYNQLTQPIKRYMLSRPLRPTVSILQNNLSRRMTSPVWHGFSLAQMCPLWRMKVHLASAISQPCIRWERSVHLVSTLSVRVA